MTMVLQERDIEAVLNDRGGYENIGFRDA